MGHLTETESNIVSTHISGIERVTRDKNLFLFIRKGTKESCALIKSDKFPTKSMDVHDKSSDWGPMSGLVPCDPFFCKKNEGVPKPDKKADRYHANVHGTEKPVHLPHYPEIIRMSGMQPLVGYALVGEQVMLLSSSRAAVAEWKHIQRIRTNSIVEPQFFTATKNGRQTDFCILENKVYWIKWTSGSRSAGGEIFPVWVWAYPNGPVTGDYDLWMVCPHWKQWKEHSTASIHKDSHTKGEKEGSAVTELIKELIGELNSSCQRSRFPVFRHGAESQNYGFTQSLDDSFLMFTPGGTSAEIKQLAKDSHMAEVLADIQDSGYLVYWNKRYSEVDSRLGGKPWYKRTIEVKAEDGSKRQIKPHLLREFLNYALYEQEVSKANGGQGASAARFRFTVQSVLNRTDPKIRKFYADLTSLSHSTESKLRYLTPADFPTDFALLEKRQRDLLQRAQRLVVNATAATGTGESDRQLIEEAQKIFKELECL